MLFTLLNSGQSVCAEPSTKWRQNLLNRLKNALPAFIVEEQGAIVPNHSSLTTAFLHKRYWTNFRTPPHEQVSWLSRWIWNMLMIRWVGQWSAVFSKSWAFSKKLAGEFFNALWCLSSLSSSMGIELLGLRRTVDSGKGVLCHHISSLCVPNFFLWLSKLEAVSWGLICLYPPPKWVGDWFGEYAYI